MKSPRLLRNNPDVLSYVCFNPIYRASRAMRKKFRYHVMSKARWVRVKAFVSAV